MRPARQLLNQAPLLWALALLSIQLFLLALPCAAQAGAPEDAAVQTEGPRVERIEFEGLRRVEAAAVRLVMSTKEGRPLRPESVVEDIRAIYGMGFFRDVKVQRELLATGGVRLVYQIFEKPAVRKIEIRGFDEISEDDIKEVLDIKPFTILDDAQVKRNAEKVKDLYNEKGFYLAEVEAKVETKEKKTKVKS